MKNCVLGIDPGFSGALAVLNFKDNHIETIFDMPLITSATGKRQLDLAFISAFVSQWLPRLEFAAVEDVGPRPREGVASVFKFGLGAGQIQGILAGLRLPFLLVAPSVWKSSMNLSQDKKLSLKKANEIFPQSFKYFLRNKDDGRAEAALIAHFAGKIFNS